MVKSAQCLTLFASSAVEYNEEKRLITLAPQQHIIATKEHYGKSWFCWTGHDGRHHRQTTSRGRAHGHRLQPYASKSSMAAGCRHAMGRDAPTGCRSGRYYLQHGQQFGGITRDRQWR